MSILAALENEPQVDDLIGRLPPTTPISGFDNRDTWDNRGGGSFDNRPTWDNWKKG
ncbi:multiple cyclophane-containing RiPP AmcA [Nocardiopsis sp. YSL2]|uniref:multiple cyclophane-containing RiPP AmcA n=1 Tax=Nocardiopsis sp. YSL2 TaxID=2939492 RepID=UPI0026F46D9A|nr:multiple cyclophane-containing RiPP AmcA [Nocardiopsis sp. YSL2]